MMKRYILNYSIRDITIRNDSIKHFPVRLLSSNQKPFITLCDYMLFLNATEERKTREKELIDFIDRQIIDSLVYELYFKEKFHEDKLYQEPKEYLLELVSKYLKPINYDKCSKLFWKKQLERKLTSQEEKELNKLEEENMKIIKEVFERIKNDKRIVEQIEKIKGHKWVKVVEGREK